MTQVYDIAKWTREDRIRRLFDKGFSRRDIRSVLGCSIADVAAVVGRCQPTGGTAMTRAVAELLADGCDPEIVKANFGGHNG